MSKFDDFFESDDGSKMTDRILRAAQPELDLLRKRNRQKIGIRYFVSALTMAALAVVFLKIKSLNGVESEFKRDVVAVEQGIDGEQADIMVSLLDDADTLDMVDDLGLLQDLDNVSQMTDEELEG